LFGAAEDPEFEQHIDEGPYVALGDTVPDRYKYDSRVRYVRWPVPQSYLEHEIVEAIGFGALYQPGLRLYQGTSSLVGRLRGISGPQAQKKTILQTAGVAAIAVGAAFALGALRGSREAIRR